MATVELRCDPFARATLMRALWTQKGVCAWCGQEKRLWVYWWEPDALHSHPSFTNAQMQLRHKFCGIKCWEAWHDF